MCTYEHTLFGSISSTCFTGDVVNNIYDPTSIGSIIIEIFVFCVVYSYIRYKK